MANRFTGAYDVSIELAPAGANALLAAIHAKGHAMPGLPGPNLLHSLALNLPFAGSAATHGLKGHLQVQLSTPSVSVAEGPPGRVTVALELYAWFQKAPGGAPAPEFVHGTLRFTTAIAIVECAGNTLAEVRIGADAAEVAFTPAPGTVLSDAQRELLVQAVRDLLRHALGPVQYRVGSLGSGPVAVGHVGFRTLRSGGSSAFLLLISFGDGSGPQPDATAVSEIYLASGDEVALALGREFLAARLRAAALGHLSGIAVSGSRFGVSFNAAPDPATLAIELRPGALRATIEGTGALSPGGSFRFRLRQDFGVTASAGNLMLTLLGGPALDIIQGNTFLDIVFWIFRGRILDQLALAAAGVVQVASAGLDALVDSSIQDLVDELGTPGVSLRIVRAAIHAEAVILGGVFDLGPSRPVSVSFTSAIESQPATSFMGATKFDALESWIPGGTIGGYTWSQVRADGGIQTQVDEEHRFVLRTEPILGMGMAQHHGWPPAIWCLQVRGTQFRGALGVMPAGGAACHYAVVVPTVDVAIDGGRLTVEVPDGAGGSLADLDPWSRYRAHAFAGATESRGYLLVHLAGREPKAALAILREVLREVGGELPILPTIVATERDKLGEAAREFADFALTGDPEGAWRRRFELEREGTTVLIGPGGAELWREAGALRADELRKVLKAIDLRDARPPRRQGVQLSLSPGVVAPPIFFQCTPPEFSADFGGSSMSSYKLRGQALELVFWTTWSAAALEELRRRSGKVKGAARTILVNDGEDPGLAARFLKQHGMAYEHAANDPDRQLSRHYGISCWPTVVHIDATGRIAGARFGLEHAHSTLARPGSAPDG